MSRSLPPANWYPDPHVPGLLRWWDGRAWTAHTHQTPQPISQSSTTAAPEAAINSVASGGELETRGRGQHGRDERQEHAEPQPSTVEVGGVHVSFTAGTGLVLNATNFAAKSALGTRQLTLPLAALRSIDASAPGTLRPGTLTIGTGNGDIRLSYGRKHKQAVDWLIVTVQAALRTAREAFQSQPADHESSSPHRYVPESQARAVQGASGDGDMGHSPTAMPDPTSLDSPSPLGSSTAPAPAPVGPGSHRREGARRPGVSQPAAARRYG